MTGLFFASVLAGIIAGAPFGAAGAMVADAALVHDRTRLNATVGAAVAGDSLLAFLISFASSPVKTFLHEYENIFFISAGTAIIVLGAFVWRLASASDPSAVRTAGPVSVFFVTLLHPGSIATFLIITALFAMHFPVFMDHRVVFALGIAAGSFCVFGSVGVLFWMIRTRAEKYLRHFRRCLAAMIALAGVYLLVKGFFIV